MGPILVVIVYFLFRMVLLFDVMYIMCCWVVKFAVLSYWVRTAWQINLNTDRCVGQFAASFWGLFHGSFIYKVNGSLCLSTYEIMFQCAWNNVLLWVWMKQCFRSLETKLNIVLSVSTLLQSFLFDSQQAGTWL